MSSFFWLSKVGDGLFFFAVFKLLQKALDLLFNADTPSEQLLARIVELLENQEPSSEFYEDSGSPDEDALGVPEMDLLPILGDPEGSDWEAWLV